MSRKFVGYHGTTKENADGIKTTRKFSPSRGENEWLGDGVYFFEDDIKQAQYFCVKARKYKNWTVFRSNIEGELIIDLAMTEHYELFLAFAKKIRDRYKSVKTNPRSRCLLNSKIFNLLHESIPYDIARGIFAVPPGYHIIGTNIVPYQIQLAVRNPRCILTIEEVV